MINIYLASSWRNPHHRVMVDLMRDMGFGVYDFKNPNPLYEAPLPSGCPDIFNMGGEPLKPFAFGNLTVDEKGHVGNWGAQLGKDGFKWNHGAASPAELMDALCTEDAQVGFEQDLAALSRADLLVLLLPCGLDAHLELGWAAGQGKETVVILEDTCRATLMYKLADRIFEDRNVFLRWLEKAGRTGELKTRAEVKWVLTGEDGRWVSGDRNCLQPYEIRPREQLTLDDVASLSGLERPLGDVVAGQGFDAENRWAARNFDGDGRNA